jgi:hypothetical protein
LNSVKLGKNDTLSCETSLSVRQGNFHFFRLPYDETPCSSFGRKRIRFLYDLNQDPKEWQNLANLGEYLATADYFDGLLTDGINPWEAFDLPNFDIVSSGPNPIPDDGFLTLSAQLFDDDGVPIIMPTGNYVTWQADISGVRVIDATSIELNFSLLSSFLAADSSFTVQAFYKHGGTNRVFGHDIMKIHVVSSALLRAEQITEEETQYDWFDLSGRRVKNREPNRIYISSDGQKVMILD